MRFTRHGFKELLIGSVVLVVVGSLLGYVHVLLALLVLPALAFLWAFFRDPERAVSESVTDYVSPADGKVSDVTEIEHDELIGGPAVRVGIFLSVFNVHVNRSPCDGVVRRTIYRKGRFLNALDHKNCSEHNESNTIVIDSPEGEPRAVVKQIVGLIARKIVCTVDEGDPVERGGRIGMIKFGSRTELTVPRALAPEVLCEVGQTVRGGSDVLVRVAAADVEVPAEVEPVGAPTPA